MKQCPPFLSIKHMMFLFPAIICWLAWKRLWRYQLRKTWLLLEPKITLNPSWNAPMELKESLELKTQLFSCLLTMLSENMQLKFQYAVRSSSKIIVPVQLWDKTHLSDGNKVIIVRQTVGWCKTHYCVSIKQLYTFGSIILFMDHYFGSQHLGMLVGHHLLR